MTGTSTLAPLRRALVQDHRGTGVKAVVKRSPLWTYHWQCPQCSFVVQVQMNARKDGYERTHEVLKKRQEKVAQDHYMLDHTIGERKG